MARARLVRAAQFQRGAFEATACYFQTSVRLASKEFSGDLG